MITRRNFAVGILLAALVTPALAAEDVRVAIALPGSITDRGWSQAAYEALTTAKAKYGVEFAYSEKVKEPDQVETLSDYARRGYTVVIGHGGEFQDAVDRVASRFPKTRFVVNNGLRAGKNVTTADFHFAQPAYVMGYLAGKMTQSGKVGVIAAQKFKFTTDTVAGFEKGLKAARPDGRMLVTWTGDWDDVAKGKEAALNQIGQGADVVWPTMDRATLGALQAAKEKGVYAFGLYYDAINDWPDTVLQSNILDVRGMMLSYIKTFQERGLEGKNYSYDLNTPDVVRIGTFHPKVPKDVVHEVENLVTKLKSGALKP